MKRITTTGFAVAWTAVAATTLLGGLGCGKSTPPAPVVVIDTQTDLRHDHKHLHGDPHRHDHDHGDNFSGAHAHPHAHGHRHWPAPHGGTIVSLRWKGELASAPQPTKRPVPLGPHVEIVEGFPDRLTVYFLSESEEGPWERWDVGPAPPVLRLTVESAGLTLSLDLEKNGQEGGYEATLPPQIQTLFAEQGSEIRFTDWAMDAAGHAFDVSENVVYRMGELDVVVE
ncbi:hypothetical protein Enr13x_61890 [Stieleria neptunia]|uniref:Lipoprotein n=1 Tax=Stieleria neptunia TaxID=2527979 RepID=A0A518HZL4_9BACT|nr:hypothetical protein [Stieleria neptunia]QDV46280.1 hypothetical protein Enr13x_61890 [Stieleria neptunia]